MTCYVISWVWPVISDFINRSYGQCDHEVRRLLFNFWCISFLFYVTLTLIFVVWLQRALLDWFARNQSPETLKCLWVPVVTRSQTACRYSTVADIVQFLCISQAAAADEWCDPREIKRRDRCVPRGWSSQLYRRDRTFAWASCSEEYKKFYWIWGGRRRTRVSTPIMMSSR